MGINAVEMNTKRKSWTFKTINGTVAVYADQIVGLERDFGPDGEEQVYLLTTASKQPARLDLTYKTAWLMLFDDENHGVDDGLRELIGNPKE